MKLQERGARNIGATLDFSGVDLFWKMMEELSSDREPAESQWASLFETPGYRVLTEREFTRDFFQRNFRTAYMPSKKAELLVALRRSKERPYLNHYVRVRQRKDAIVRYLTGLKASDLSARAMAAASSYLPQRFRNTVTAAPRTAFLVFKNDARGHDPIVMDALASMEWGDLSLFLGHEFHHYYRNKLPSSLNFAEAASGEDCLLNMLVSIESEGIADLINMDQTMSKPTAMWKRRKKRYDGLLAEVPDAIRYLDRWISKTNLSSANWEKACGELRARIADSGHEMGNYMAKVALERFGKEELVETVGNPFDFIGLYEKAAAGTAQPCFSARSIRTIRNLGHSLSR